MILVPYFSIKFFLIISYFLISGCAFQSDIPIEEVNQPPSERIFHHFVSDGDTLYSIAWRYNLDPDHLAFINKIKKPYKIFEGDRINLKITSTELNKNINISNKDPSKNTVDKFTAPYIENKEYHQNKWYWPAKGKITKNFKSSKYGSHKGIDIESFKGASVLASNSGRVVYSGSGLPAYGKLIILKHDDIYLSAYAHNDRLLVKEGDKVKAGEKIAEMGQTGATYNHLHFEIRKKGVPINPNLLLPKQG